MRALALVIKKMRDDRQDKLFHPPLVSTIFDRNLQQLKHCEYFELLLLRIYTYIFTP